MVWIWQRDPTVCPTCEHPTRLHNTSGCIMPHCSCAWRGRSTALLLQVAAAWALILAIVVWTAR